MNFFEIKDSFRGKLSGYSASVTSENTSLLKAILKYDEIEKFKYEANPDYETAKVEMFVLSELLVNVSHFIVLLGKVSSDIENIKKNYDSEFGKLPEYKSFVITVKNFLDIYRSVSFNYGERIRSLRYILNDKKDIEG